MKYPDQSHPIRISPEPNRITVYVKGQVLADTHRALALLEAEYPSVNYIPRDDVDMARLQRSAKTTYCPYKGTANYFHIQTPDGLIENAVWTYETPYPSVEKIAGYVAFYPQHVEIHDASRI